MARPGLWACSGLGQAQAMKPTWNLCQVWVWACVCPFTKVLQIVYGNCNPRFCWKGTKKKKKIGVSSPVWLESNRKFTNWLGLSLSTYNLGWTWMSQCQRSPIWVGLAGSCPKFTLGFIRAQGGSGQLRNQRREKTVGLLS